MHLKWRVTPFLITEEFICCTSTRIPCPSLFFWVCRLLATWTKNQHTVHKAHFIILGTSDFREEKVEFKCIKWDRGWSTGSNYSGQWQLPFPQPPKSWVSYTLLLLPVNWQDIRLKPVHAPLHLECGNQLTARPLPRPHLSPSGLCFLHHVLHPQRSIW